MKHHTLGEMNKQAERCEEHGHEWEIRHVRQAVNRGCSILMQIYQRCKWCGAIR
jgi:hypothetical protein